VKLLQKYIDEIGKDLVVDDFNLKEVQMRLPARKHFWVARLMDAKVEKNILIAKKKRLKKELTKKVIADSPVKISLSTAEQHAERHDSVVQLTESINEYTVIVEYLEKCEKVLSSMSFDLKNIVEINKLEML
jgi:hypothetical protein